MNEKVNLCYTLLNSKLRFLIVSKSKPRFFFSCFYYISSLFPLKHHVHSSFGRIQRHYLTPMFLKDERHFNNSLINFNTESTKLLESIQGKARFLVIVA